MFMQGSSGSIAALPWSDSVCPRKVDWVHGVVNSLLDAMLVRGFHGVGTLRIDVQDGIIRFLEDGIERSTNACLSGRVPSASAAN
jgi:hypothetical protein